MKFRQHKKLILGFGISIGVVAIGSVAAVVISQHSHSRSARPDYKTVAPYNKSSQELGGWKRVSPPDQDPVFAYSDTLKGVSISVSQQPLPSSFRTNTKEKVAELAKKFNATNKIDAFGTPAYIGTSAKGPQSVILTKSSLLIMIKSQGKIPDQSWAEYIQSLVLQNDS